MTEEFTLRLLHTLWALGRSELGGEEVKLFLPVSINS
jgi:hypothetical protein